MDVAFQFLLVRLRANTIKKARLILLKFQFLLVRLRDIELLKYLHHHMISIPSGAIKSY